eukprot:39178-Amphidinium_carterae.1
MHEEDTGWSLYPNGELEVVFRLHDGVSKTVRFQRTSAQVLLQLMTHSPLSHHATGAEFASS